MFQPILMAESLVRVEDITENHILQASEFIKELCGIPISDLHHAKGALMRRPPE